MIRNIVFFTARDATDLPRITAGLQMLAQIPHARHFEVGQNLHADRLTGAEADLAAYTAHPIYDDAIRRVRPLRDIRIAADIAAL